MQQTWAGQLDTDQKERMMRMGQERCSGKGLLVGDID